MSSQIFEVGRYDAEYLAKLVGKVDPEVVKRDPKTTNQYELFSSLMEQWEGWTDQLRFQPDRTAIVSVGDRPVQQMKTQKIPTYNTTEAQVEQVRIYSTYKNGVIYNPSMRESTEAETAWEPSGQVPIISIPAYEVRG